jgi:hypothetical protein
MKKTEKSRIKDIVSFEADLFSEINYLLIKSIENT